MGTHTSATTNLYTSASLQAGAPDADHPGGRACHGPHGLPPDCFLDVQNPAGLDPDLVTRAICSGFITEPQECKELLTPRNPMIPFAPQKVNGVSFGTLILWL